MAKSVSVIGLDPSELPWVGLVIGLLRHPNPTMSELVRQALIYLNQTSPCSSDPSPDAAAADAEQLDNAS